MDENETPASSDVDVSSPPPKFCNSLYNFLGF
jgi:hypothetical protein